MTDCLCGECSEHFTGLQTLLSAAGVSFVLNPRLVRGLDYYTKTAFEIQYTPLGAQSAVCGGGRYDGLIAECGGQPTPGIGFAMGMERLLLALEKQNLFPPLATAIDLFVAPMDKSAQPLGLKLMTELRRSGIACDMDYMNRSLKAQMKYANKYPARFVAIIGEEEVAQNKVMLKDMVNGEQQLMTLDAVRKMMEEGMK